MAIQERKVIIIGAGHVGSHVGYALASQGLVEKIVYIDTDEDKAIAQALDIFDSTNYLPHHVEVIAGNYEEAKDADLLIIAAGPLPDIEKRQTRMDTLRQTVEILKEIIPQIKASGFEGIIINISNPADVVAHYVQNELDYPAHKILSTSTTLDSARLRRAISVATGIDQKSIYGYVLGEHGESQMVPWSTVTIGGKSILELIREKPEQYGHLDLAELANAGRKGGWTILGGKGSTEFGIGASAAEVVRSILFNEKRVLPISVLLKGEYGQQEVYASVPAVLDRNGVEEIIELPLTSEEQATFSASCDIMKENYQLAKTL